MSDVFTMPSVPMGAPIVPAAPAEFNFAPEAPALGPTTGSAMALPKSNKMPGFGEMTPDQFSSVFGQAGAALSKKGSWQQQLGTMAGQMGNTKLAGLAALKQDAASKKTFTDLLDKYPGLAPQILAASGTPIMPVGGVGTVDTVAPNITK
jgi:hypothetical protein